MFSFKRGTLPMLPGRMHASSGSKYYTGKGFSCQYRTNTAYSSSKRKGVRRHNLFNSELNSVGMGEDGAGQAESKTSVKLLES